MVHADPLQNQAPAIEFEAFLRTDFDTSNPGDCIDAVEHRIPVQKEAPDLVKIRAAWRPELRLQDLQLLVHKLLLIACQDCFGLNSCNTVIECVQNFGPHCQPNTLSVGAIDLSRNLQSGALLVDLSRSGEHAVFRNMDGCCRRQPHMPINSRPRVPSTTRYLAVVHLHSDNIVTALQFA